MAQPSKDAAIHGQQEWANRPGNGLSQMETQQHNRQNAKASSAAAFDAKTPPSAAMKNLCRGSHPKGKMLSQWRTKGANKGVKATAYCAVELRQMLQVAVVAQYASPYASR